MQKPAAGWFFLHLVISFVQKCYWKIVLFLFELYIHMRFFGSRTLPSFVNTIQSFILMENTLKRYWVRVVKILVPFLVNIWGFANFLVYALKTYLEKYLHCCIFDSIVIPSDLDFAKAKVRLKLVSDFFPNSPCLSGHILESKGMCMIFQRNSKNTLKKGKKGKTSFGKNIQNSKIFWKRVCFLSHLYLQTLQGLLPCFPISSAYIILFSSSLPAKQFMTKFAWNVELLHVLSSICST